MGWIFVSPFIIGLLFIYLEVLVNSFIFSMNTIVMVPGGYRLDSLGFENYRQILLVNPNYNRTIIESIQTMLVNIPTVVFFSLFIAILLNQKMKFRGFYRMVFFIPVILATGILEKLDIGNLMLGNMSAGGGIDSGLSTGTIGGGLLKIVDLQLYLSKMSFSPAMTTFVISAVGNLLNVVNACGVQILIFLAGLQSIPESIYEAAYMEGATGWECFWKITLVLISPMIFVNSLYTIVDSFTSHRNPVIAMIFDKGLAQANFGEASAMVWIYFLVVLVFIGLTAAILSKMVFYQQK